MDLSSYEKMYDECKILPDKEEIVFDRAKAIVANKNLYIIVSAKTKIPWDVIGCIHSLESDLSLSKHLHNGDPLTSRTINVPTGRPQVGDPPFTWVESAIDALKTYPRSLLWDIGTKLYFLESYNGMGYRKFKIQSPYLWSMTDKYSKGKFDSDGHFNEELISKQIGAVPLLKNLTK